jgi:hypothetical protein
VEIIVNGYCHGIEGEILRGRFLGNLEKLSRLCLRIKFYVGYIA